MASAAANNPTYPPADAEPAKPFDPGAGLCVFPPLHDGRNAASPSKSSAGKGETKSTETVWISAPFEVLGGCRDPHGAGWGKVLRWRDDDGRQHVRHVADADMHGEPAALCAGLAHHGLRIDPDAAT